jgi:hypothetical protein
MKKVVETEMVGKPVKRGKRRAAREKFVKRAKKLYPDNAVPQKFADYRTPCSCHMCRNPRHSGYVKGSAKATMQERRHAQEDKHGTE